MKILYFFKWRLLSNVLICLSLDAFSQSSLIFDNDTIIKENVIYATRQVALSQFKEQTCYHSDKQYFCWLEYLLVVDSPMTKDDYLSMKFLKHLEIMPLSVRKKDISKKFRSNFYQRSKQLALVWATGFIYDDNNHPVASTNIKTTYCYVSSEQHYSNLIKKTFEYKITHWFCFIDPVYGYFNGLVGIDNNSKLWAIHKEKGGIMPFYEYIETYWKEWVEK